MKKSKLLCVYEANMPTVSIVRETIGIISEYGNIEYLFRNIREVNKKDVDEADIVMLIRPSDVMTVSLEASIKGSGRLILVYFDDDLLNIYSKAENPLIHGYLKKALKMADVVVSPNYRLAKKLAAEHHIGRAVQMDTIVDRIYCKPSDKSDNERVKFVYAAGCFHGVFFEEIVLPALREIDGTYGDRIQIDFIGVHPRISEDIKNIRFRYCDTMPLEKYRKYVSAQRYEYGFALLHDNSFMNHKYYNKYIEYSILGICGIYSNLEPYRQVVRDGCNGYMVDEGTESWSKAIIRAVVDRKQSESMVEAAQKDLLERQSEENIWKKLSENIPEMITGCKKKEIKVKSNRLRHYRDRVIYVGLVSKAVLEAEGLSGLRKKVCNYIVQRKAY